ncbi:MAG: response regulator transcription factor [Nocardioidaceae bacterium]
MCRVLLADDDLRVRAGLRDILDSDPGLHVVAEAGDGREAVELARRHRPDVALLDIRMPVLDGLAAADQIIRTAPDTAVVMVTTFGDDAYVDTAVGLGVAGFLLKSGDPRDLIAGCRAAAHGGSCLSPAVARHVLDDLRAMRATTRHADPNRLTALSPRQLELLALLSLGQTNAEIAHELHLSEGTVKGYLRDLFTKLDVRNRVEAALLAHEAGITTAGSKPTNDHTNKHSRQAR